MTAVDLINIPRVIDPQLSADGRQVAFTLLEPDWKLGRRVPQVWRVGADGTALRKLTSSEGGVSTARWSPDGSMLAVLAQAGGRTQIHLLSAEGGDSKPLSDHPTAPSSPTWAPDGRALYFLAPDAPTPDQLERERTRGDVFAFDENFSQVHLWRVAVEDGRETRLTDGQYSVLGFSVAPDGRRLRHQPRPVPAARRGGAERGVDCRGGRHESMAGHRQPRPRSRERPRAGQLAAALRLGGQRRVRALLPVECLPGAGDGRPAPPPAARLSLRGGARRLGSRQPRHPHRREHGRPQRDCSASMSRRSSSRS